MSIVLIVDPNSEEIKKQIETIKGVICFAAKTFQEAEGMILKDQFDFILFDFKLVDEYKTGSFVDFCRVKQPCMEFYYILEDDPDKKNVCDIEVKKSNGYLLKPLGHDKIFDLVNGDNLIDQDDIDALFSQC